MIGKLHIWLLANPKCKQWTYCAICCLTVLLSSINSVSARTSVPQSQTTSSIDEPKYAIVIGINQYRHYPHLNYSVTDARKLAEKFSKLGYTVKLLENFDADPEHILNNIYHIGDLLDAGGGRDNGTIVVAFSGHGFQQDGENFLATGKSNPANLRRTSLAVSTLKSVLSKSGIAKTMMFIDACRNTPTKSLPENNTFSLDAANDGTGIIYSTAAGELSWEDNFLGQGVFSYYLAEALGGAASDEKGLVTFNSVFEHLRLKVPNHVFSRYGKEQFPYIAGERAGDLSIGTVNTNNAPIAGTKANSVSAGTAATNAETAIEDIPATTVKHSGWKKTITILGAIVIGAMIINNKESSQSQQQEPSITLVVPTP